MSFILDTDVVARNFSNAASTYDDCADHHRQIAARLADFLPQADSVNSILELGCGTGIMTRILIERYGNAALTALDIAPAMIDVCYLQFRDTIELLIADAASYRSVSETDLIVSSATLQWVVPIDDALKAMRASLAENGRICLAIPVEGTLWELEESFRDAAEEFKRLPLASPESYKEAINRAGFAITKAVLEDVTVTYKTPLDALNKMRGTGAVVNGQPDFTSLTFAKMRAVLAAYSRRFAAADGSVPLSYRVLYLSAEAQ